MKVAVIGAGPSGLVAVKELLEEGHQVVCFEKAAEIGGVYRFDEKGNGVWENCRLTSSALITSFSDFPPPPDASLQFTHSEYLRYLNDYAAHFGLRSSIRFGHSVERVSQRDGTGWNVVVRRGTECEDHVFEAIVVCSGIHQTPTIPELPGQSEFRGEVLHAAAYKNTRPFADKRVVIVGAGESGADIAAEIADAASACVLSMRRAPYLFPRLIRGLPNDYYTTRLRYSLPAWVERIKNPRATVFRRKVVLGALTLPLSLLVYLFETTENLFRRIWRTRLFRKYSLDLQVERIINEYRKKSGGGPAEQFATKSAGFVYSILAGSCEPRPAIAGFTPEGVRFEDGTEYQADVVVFCTGYRSSFPFLDIGVPDARNLFKNFIEVETGSKLGFIGLVRPGIGAIPPISEMQARWFALLCSGSLCLPDKETMRAEAKLDAQTHRAQFPHHTDRLPHLVDFTSYLDDLAARVGCKPSFRELVLHPRVAYAVYAAPFSAHQYRLQGPHAKPAVVVPLLRRLPRTVALKRIPLHILSILMCKALAAMGFNDFRPHLRLIPR